MTWPSFDIREEISSSSSSPATSSWCRHRLPSTMTVSLSIRAELDDIMLLQWAIQDTTTGSGDGDDTYRTTRPNGDDALSKLRPLAKRPLVITVTRAKYVIDGYNERWRESPTGVARLRPPVQPEVETIYRRGTNVFRRRFVISVILELIAVELWWRRR